MERAGLTWRWARLCFLSCRNMYHLLATTDRTDLLDLAHAHHCDIQAFQNDGTDPLFLAVKARQKTAWNWFLQHGAKPDIEDLEGDTPLLHICCNMDMECLKALLKHGANANYKAGPQAVTPLHVAAEAGTSSAVDVLLHHGANVHAQCAMGETALHKATKTGHVRVIKMLIKAGVVHVFYAACCMSSDTPPPPPLPVMRSGHTVRSRPQNCIPLPPLLPPKNKTTPCPPPTHLHERQPSVLNWKC